MGRLWANGLFLLPGFQFERLATDFVDTGSSGSSAWSQWGWWFQGETDGEKSGEQWHSYFAGQRYLTLQNIAELAQSVGVGPSHDHPSLKTSLLDHVYKLYFKSCLSNA